MSAFIGPIFDSDLRAIEDALAEVRQRLHQRREAALEEAIQHRHEQSPAVELDPLILLAKAKAIYAGRRARDRIFEGLDLFAEPAWDILLDLYAAHVDRHMVSVSSVAIAASVPPTTALRWIELLIVQGLVERERDPFDHRRTYLLLTDAGVKAAARAITVS